MTDVICVTHSIAIIIKICNAINCYENGDDVIVTSSLRYINVRNFFRTVIVIWYHFTLPSHNMTLNPLCTTDFVAIRINPEFIKIQFRNNSFDTDNMNYYIFLLYNTITIQVSRFFIIKSTN